MPIVKDHYYAGVTLTFKNHFGTIDAVVRAGDDNLHHDITSALLDIYLNPHIRDKTVLVVGDGLYGALENTNTMPSRWSTFGNDAPNSLFFAVDPVAIDCVMLDILDAEPVNHPRWVLPDAYLELAAAAGLGIFERGDLGGSGYNQIDYLKIEL